jgi:alkylation response protein AidB-like acyl-CoA dehydrogenase
MDVRLSPEQQALRDSVAQVCDHLAAHAVGELDDAERADKLDAAVTASGWRELRVPDDGGSPLASGVEVAIVATELGRGLADAAYAGPTLAAELRRLGGVPAATAPETVVLNRSLGGPAIVRDGEVPAGAVAIDAAGAAGALVLVPDGESYALAEVTLAPTEVRADLTRPMASVDASSSPVELDGERLLTADDLATWTALGLALTCADLVGVMRGAVDLSVAYAADRSQYGRPIGSFQAVQHLLADAFVLVEGSRSAALHAAWAVDALDPEDALGAAAVAKAYCARSARVVAETAIQVHGGIGNTWECLAHVFLRRALLSSDVLGDADASLDLVLAHHRIGGRDGLR